MFDIHVNYTDARSSVHVHHAHLTGIYYAHHAGLDNSEHCTSNYIHPVYCACALRCERAKSGGVYSCRCKYKSSRASQISRSLLKRIDMAHMAELEMEVDLGNVLAFLHAYTAVDP